MGKPDFRPQDFTSLNWEPGKLAEPLAKVYGYTIAQARSGIDWYFDKRRFRQFFCRICRLGAIFLTAFAGLLPILNEITKEQGPIGVRPAATAPSGSTEQVNTNKPPETKLVITQAVNGNWLHPLWSAVALAVAATIIMLDRFYGFTTGWVRYILTAQQLGQVLEVFQLEIERQKVSWGKTEPTQEQAAAMLVHIQEFLKEVHTIIRDETKTWAAEFAEVLKQLDEQVKLAAQAMKEGGIQITSTNGDKCADGWQLTIGDRTPEKRSGKSASVTVPPGMYLVRATGQIDGKAVRAEQVAKVAAGEIVKVELTLS